MQINTNTPISKQTFQAHLCKTKVVTQYLSYLDRASKNSTSHKYESSKNLFTKIEQAFENHPSTEMISLSSTSKLFNPNAIYGVISSKKFKIVDVEPSPKNFKDKPMENILRRILSPQNQKAFDKIVGEEYSTDYQVWWNKNIAPIWDQINRVYKDANSSNNEFQLNKNFLLQAETSSSLSFLKNIINRFFR